MATQTQERSATQADVRRGLGLEPNPVLDAPIIGPARLSDEQRAAAEAIRALRELQRVGRQSRPCDECRAPVPIVWALASHATQEMVLCDDCRLDTAFRARLKALSDEERAIYKAYQRTRNKSQVGRELSKSRFAVARALKRINRKLEV